MAQLLDELALPFTWEDSGERFCAWPASAGVIYPERDDDLERGWWAAWHARNAHLGISETAGWWYNTKAPPHGSRAQPIAESGVLKRGSHDATVVSARGLVSWAREYYAGRRVFSGPPGARRIVTHGYSERLVAYLWGWTAVVRPGALPAQEDGRPCVYFRRGRFTFGYLAPLPGTPNWLAGSAMIPQRKGARKELAIEPKVEKWQQNLGALAGLEIEEVLRLNHGWRPVAGDLDEGIRKRPDGTLVLRPASHSGFKGWPKVEQELRGLL